MLPYTLAYDMPQMHPGSSVDIPIAEGPVNLNWGPIMKTINEDPYDFFQQGGWSFLGGTAVEEVSSRLS